MAQQFPEQGSIFKHSSSGDQVEVEGRTAPEDSYEGDEMVVFRFIEADEGTSLPVDEFYHWFEKVADSWEER